MGFFTAVLVLHTLLLMFIRGLFQGFIPVLIASQNRIIILCCLLIGIPMQKQKAFAKKIIEVYSLYVLQKRKSNCFAKKLFPLTYNNRPDWDKKAAALTILNRWSNSSFHYFISALFLFKKSISFPKRKAVSSSLQRNNSYSSFGILWGFVLS